MVVAGIVNTVVWKGRLYAEMLDMRRPLDSSAARVVDQISGNCKFKMSVARVKEMDEPLDKKFRSFSWAPRNVVYQGVPAGE